MLIKYLAESGVFNLAGLTPIESACRANLYEAMQYLAAKSAEAQIAEAMAKQK